MSIENFKIVLLPLSLLFTSFIIYRAIRITVPSNTLNSFILDKFQTNSIMVNSISKLTFQEKIKYGDPPINFFRIYNYYFGIFSGKMQYSRKITLEKNSNEHETKYISIQTKNRELDQLKEFDSYKF